MVSCAVLLGLSVACGGSPGDAHGSGGTTAGELADTARKRVEQPWVLFSKRELVINALELPFNAPVLVGSAPSPTTLESSDPSTVSVSIAGELVGHRPGKAVIRSTTGSTTLLVRVVTARELRIEPKHLELASGAVAHARVFADGAEVPPDGVQWGMTDPSVVTVVNGEIRAVASGQAQVVAQFAGKSARCAVTVSNAPRHGLRIMPYEPTANLGSAVPFQLMSDDGPVPDVAWSSSNPRILEHIRNGIFRAVSPGEAKVCALTRRSTTCTSAKVQP